MSKAPVLNFEEMAIRAAAVKSACAGRGRFPFGARRRRPRSEDEERALLRSVLAKALRFPPAEVRDGVLTMAFYREA